MGKGNCSVYKVGEVLLIVGGLNWGLVGALQLDLVAMLLGGMDSMLARAVYVLVGLAALGQLGHLFGMCKCQKDGGAKPSAAPQGGAM